MPKLTNDQLLLSIEILESLIQYVPSSSKSLVMDRLVIALDELAARTVGVQSTRQELLDMLASYKVEPFGVEYETESSSEKPNLVSIKGSDNE